MDTTMQPEKNWFLILGNLLPVECFLSLIFEMIHLVMEDIGIWRRKDDPRFYPYGFDGMTYVGLTAAFYIFVGLKFINIWCLLRGKKENRKIHLWTRLALLKLGITLFITRSMLFRSQRFGDAVGFKTVAGLHYCSNNIGVIITLQAIEKNVYDELLRNPQEVFYRRWTWCRLHLRKLSILLIITTMCVWIFYVIKITMGGIEQVSKFGGYGNYMLVLLVATVSVSLFLVGVLNIVGIVLRNMKTLFLAYVIRLITILQFTVATCVAYKVVKLDLTQSLVIGSVAELINVNLLLSICDVQAASLLRWITYIKLQKSLPIGEINRDTNCFQSKEDIPKQMTQILEDLYVSMPWRMTTGDMLGEGHFSKVYKVELRGICSRKAKVYAAKEVEMEELDMEDYASALVSEIKTLHVLGKHENLVEFAGLYDIKSSGGLGILLEYCENGSLLDNLRNMGEDEISNPKNCILQTFLQWSKEIALGMEYLHSRKVVHGDLAARNILLDSNMVCKISDFGMSFKLYTYETYKRMEQKPLPFRWMSPEVMLDYKFSPASDSWAYGVTLWEMFSFGDEPWGKCNFDGKFVRNIQIEENRLERPELCPEILYESILLKCWELEPQDRLDATIILKELELFMHDKGCSEFHLIIDG